jgi:hypothetical protein
VFAAVFFAGPILGNCMVLVMGLVWDAKDLLIEVKREEFKRARGGGKKSDGGSKGGGKKEKGKGKGKGKKED